MVDQVGIATATTPASPGTLDLTSPDITETFRGALLIVSASTSDGTNNAGAIIGIGFVSAERGTGVTGEESACWFAQNGQNTTPNTGFRHSTTRCVSVVDTTGTGILTIGAVYSASIAGGVRLNFTTTTIQAKITAIIFAGQSRVAADNASSTTSSATEAVGDDGVSRFTPDALFFLASDSAVGADASANNVGAHPNLGLALNLAGFPQVMAYVSSDDTTEPGDADGYLRSARAFGDFSGARAAEVATISAYPSNGFTHSADTGTITTHYLALKWANASRVRTACKNLPVSASTGIQSWADFGFVPDLVFGMGTVLAAQDAAVEDGANAGAMSFFVSGRFGSRAWTWHTEEGLTLAGLVVANSHTRQEDVAVLQYDHQGNIVWRGTWVGHAGGGFGINFSVASKAGFITLFGIQLIPTPPPGADHQQAGPARGGPARARRVITAGIKRAARYGRFLRTLLRNRAQAERARRSRLPEPAVTLHLTTDPALRTGDNAFPGSWKGGDAGAGSIAGDSA